MRVSTAELLAIQEIRKKKFKTCHYVGKLLHALFQKQQLPAIPNFADPQIKARIEKLTTHIVTLHEEFREQL